MRPKAEKQKSPYLDHIIPVHTTYPTSNCFAQLLSLVATSSAASTALLGAGAGAVGAGVGAGIGGGVVVGDDAGGGGGSSRGGGGGQGGGGDAAGGSPSRRAARGGAARGGAGDDKVDAAHVGLVDGAGVPPPLDGATTRGGANIGQVGGEGTAEGGLVGGDTGGGGGVAGPRVYGADDGVLSQVDDGDVGDARVRGGDGDGEFDGLAGREALDGVGGGVVELVATALPEVAGGGVVVGLRPADLGHGLDVAVGVRRNLAVDLRAAGALEGVTQGARRGRGQTTVGRDTHGEDGGGRDLSVHLDGMCSRTEQV